MGNFLVGSVVNDIHQFINLKYSINEILYYSSYEKKPSIYKNKCFFIITEYSKKIKNIEHKIIKIATLQDFDLEIKRELINFNYSVIRGSIL